ncbi:two-component system, OmpR family, phosphate regulon sensor histidine kinase PhoR [Mariprofundus micogutta]|uniref:histidine kinase n=1 Tax=Mariprofundus micogutta TaxID=1921010 RepID=A0A1L8CKN5_9PROT|nr:ATP-binding protein [Mariprofundus micogutta]GAV19488.1 two-component system, OmpR family, phosphate regulon sensor histidine kinase PhoR [Mariprofundus micogutta]
MTAGWILLILGILIFWFFQSRSKNEQLRQYKTEVRRLQESRGGLEKTVATHGRRLDVLFSAVNEVVMRVDHTGRILSANTIASKRFAMHRQHELPQSMLLFYRDPDWHKAFSSALKRLPEPSSLPDMDVDGRKLSPRLAPLGSDQALLLCVDMTETYKLEAQRRTFLSNLMHDLKTPLTSLLGYARSMDKFGDDEDFRQEAAQVIADEAKHVNHLLDALLTLDQIEFSAREDDVCCKAEDVLQQVCDMLMPRCRDNDIELLCNIDSSGIILALQDDELERVVTNLLVNAVNHAPQCSQVQLRLIPAGQTASIVIEDQGSGIPEKELSRVTERFYRVDKARTRKDGGHGLGLSIVKELVEKNDGQLQLSNIEPHGLRAEIKLPVMLTDKV